MAFSSTSTYTGLQTITIVIPASDNYGIQGTLTLPEIQPSATQGPGGGAGTGTGGGPLVASQVVVTINQNGSPIFTSLAGARGFNLKAVPLVAADVLTVVLSSSLAQDKELNTVRITLGITQGGD